MKLRVGLRGEGSFAYWAVSLGAAQDLARAGGISIGGCAASSPRTRSA